jgi:Ca2+-transporting ATPase
VVVSALVFGAGLLVGRSTPRELFLVAVALAVAAIPEGLPAVTTIVLAFGTQKMARRNALVRRLPAVETLGCAQIICTDKTGTLTQNTMTAQRVHIAMRSYEVIGDPARIGATLKASDGGASPIAADLDVAFAACVSAAGAEVTVDERGCLAAQGDPTDAALLGLSLRLGSKVTIQRIAERPFTSDRRMASLLTAHGATTRAYVRGAPEVLLERANRIHMGGTTLVLGPDHRKQISDEAAKWAARAMRVIAVAYRDDLSMPVGSVSKSGAAWEEDLTFVALIGIVDPPRAEVKDAIHDARRAGVQTLMITGDHPATAHAIAQDINLWQEGDLMLTGSQIDTFDEQKLEEQIDRLRVVARATAEHKLRIVTALKARGIVCAMTGDGVNDAPAVKAASIGVAMGRGGTDVTKEASALVLADDNYATIVAAIEEGRAIYANIRKFIFFLLSSNAGAVLFVLTASLLGWEAPLAPIQILWINLITNGLPALALGIDPREPEQMARPPREPGGAILTLREYGQIVLIGAVMAVTALFAFDYGMRDPRMAQSPEELAHARALVFAVLSVGPLFHALNCRSETRSLFSLGVFTNRALWGSIVIGLILQAITIYVPPLRPIFKTAPLDLMDVVWVIALSIVPFVLGESAKVLLRYFPAISKPGTQPA